MTTDKRLKTGFDTRAVLAGLSLLACIGATEVQKRVLAAFLPGDVRGRDQRLHFGRIKVVIC